MYSSWKNWWFSLFILTITAAIQNVNGESYYLISASRSIFSGQTYGVVVTMFQTYISTSCRITISGPNLNISMLYNLTPKDSCRFYQFPLPELEEGNYTLTAEGVRGEYFKNSTQLIWKPTNNFINIQTPKTSYRPGEVVQFRVLFFNYHLKPRGAKLNAIIKIRDGRNNVVWTFRNLRTSDGVFRGKFLLAKYPVLGRWSICLMNPKAVRGVCGYIQVLEYVPLPFKVRLRMKRNVAIQEKSIAITVLANYVSENAVKGNCILKAESHPNKNNTSLNPIKLQETKQLKDGESTFTINLDSFEKQIPNIMALQIYITAMVRESQTSDQVNATKVVNLFASPYIIECVQATGYCHTLVANIKNSLSFRMTNIDGQIVNSEDKVKLIYTSSLSSKTHSFTSNLNYAGVVNFTNIVISATKTNISSTFIYKTEMEFHGIRQPLQHTIVNTLSMRTLKVQPKTESSEISVKAGTSQYITFDRLDHKFWNVTIVVISNGNVQFGQQVLSDIFSKVDAKITFTNIMWPSAKVFMYGVEDNTLYIARKTISVKAQRNRISIRTVKSVSPGERIYLSVSTSPHSYVGLMARDESVLGLNDIVNDLDVSQIDTLWNIQANSPIKDSTSKLLDLVTLTNVPFIKDAKEGVNGTVKPKPRTISKVHPEQRRSMDRTPQVDHIRRNFSDIWIFDMLRSSSTGFNNYKYVVPDSITTWKLNAFSMHATRGLALLRTPIYIESTKELYLSSNLPYSIKIGEVLRIPVTCFNQQTETVEVMLQFNYDDEKMFLVNEHHEETKNKDKAMSINATNSAVAFYYIKPLEIGLLELTFRAMSVTVNDEIYHVLKVIGEEQFNIRTIVYIKSKPNELKVNEIPIKEWGIQQRTAKRVDCQVTNQLTSINIQNLPDFHPFDNGEVLISKLFSCLYLWDYMKSQQLLNQTLNRRLKKCIDNGFQSLLRFKRPDGGFAYYAQLNVDKSSCSSTWLSGYAVRALQMLQKMEYLNDDNILREAKDFLMSRRKGNVIFKELCQTPTRNTLSDFELTQEIFHVMKSSLKSNAVKATQKWFKYKTKMTEWDIPNIISYTRQSWLFKRQALATAGSSLLQGGSSSSEQFELFRWVISELYGQNIRHNSYESALAEQGIYKYLKRNPSKVNKLRVEIYNGLKTIKLNFNQSDDLMVKHIVMRNVNSIRFRVNGLGQVILQCGTLFKNNEYDEYSHYGESKHYNLHVTQQTNKQLLSLKLCLDRFTEDSEDYVGSVLELGLPTGYTISLKSLKELKKTQIVKQAISVNDNTKLLVELERLPSNITQCIAIEAKLLHNLDYLQPSKVMVYDVNARMEADIFTYDVSETTGKV